MRPKRLDTGGPSTPSGTHASPLTNNGSIPFPPPALGNRLSTVYSCLGITGFGSLEMGRPRHGSPHRM
jgi:hypothetical protein